MEKITNRIRAIAKEALLNKDVDKIISWEKGDLWWDSYPTFISKAEDVNRIVWDSFCVSNLSKYLIKELETTNKIGIFLKGCDSKGFNQLLKDNRVDRDRVTVYGVPCNGMVDPDKIKKMKLNKGITEIRNSKDEVTISNRDGKTSIPIGEVQYNKCSTCLHPNPVIYDELIGEESSREAEDRFARVREIEEMSPDERYEYWTEQFKKCIRCNACRDICPACSCVKCTFDSGEVSGNAKVESEDSFYHLIRAYHVAGRCVDCGECARVCSGGIPLDRLNRKIIKDINETYSEHHAGLDSTTDDPLISFELDDRDTFSTKGGR